MAPVKPTCGFCHTAPATLYCSSDAAFLCGACDTNVHGTNAMASRHARHVLCDLCETAPATTFCKNDDAHLCSQCDGQIHNSNPLAARHERVPLGSLAFPETQHSTCGGNHQSSGAHCSSEDTKVSRTIKAEPVEDSSDFSFFFEPTPAAKALKDFDAFDLDSSLFDMGMGFDLTSLDMDLLGTQEQQASDGVVPTMEMPSAALSPDSSTCSSDIVDADATLPIHTSAVSSSYLPAAAQPSTIAPMIAGMPALPSKPALAAMPPLLLPATNFWSAAPSAGAAAALEVMHVGTEVPMNREARVLRYRQKRARRSFQKTIRYESRKAYAEIRPRIKGRFATREEVLALKAGQALETVAAATVQPQQMAPCVY